MTAFGMGNNKVMIITTVDKKGKILNMTCRKKTKKEIKNGINEIIYTKNNKGNK